MDHLSFFWVSPDKHKYLRSIETEFYKRSVEAVRTETIFLPPLPEVVLKIQKACSSPDSTVRDIAGLLLDDASLAGAVINAANSVLFAPRAGAPCDDITVAVSRLGLDRVSGIATAQAIYQLKSSATFGNDCNQILRVSAAKSREFAAAMALVSHKVANYCDEPLNIAPEKALLTGLLADIGLYSIIAEYQTFLKQGHYLDFDIAQHVFYRLCSDCSRLILKHWNFDADFIEVAVNQAVKRKKEDSVSYLDIARMANHLLLFRANDEAIEEHDVEITAPGAEALYELSNLDDSEFNAQLNSIIKSASI